MNTKSKPRVGGGIWDYPDEIDGISGFVQSCDMRSILSPEGDISSRLPLAWVEYSS